MQEAGIRPRFALQVSDSKLMWGVQPEEPENDASKISLSIQKLGEYVRLDEESRLTSCPAL